MKAWFQKSFLRGQRVDEMKRNSYFIAKMSLFHGQNEVVCSYWENQWAIEVGLPGVPCPWFLRNWQKKTTACCKLCIGLHLPHNPWVILTITTVDLGRCFEFTTVPLLYMLTTQQPGNGVCYGGDSKQGSQKSSRGDNVKTFPSATVSVWRPHNLIAWLQPVCKKKKNLSKKQNNILCNKQVPDEERGVLSSLQCCHLFKCAFSHIALAHSSLLTC